MESRSSLADSPPFICLVRRVNLPSSDPSWILTFGLFQANPSPSPLCQAMFHAYSLEFRIEFPVQWWFMFSKRSNLQFNAFKSSVKSMFSGLASFNRYISLHDIHEATYHSSHFPSNLQLNTKELIRCLVYLPDYLQSELSSGSVWELKGLNQWNYPYYQLMSSNWLHYIV